MLTKYTHGLYTAKVKCNLQELVTTCDTMYKFIGSTFAKSNDYNGDSTLRSKLFTKYNFLMYPLPGVHDLYKNIHEVFNQSYYEYFGYKNNRQHFIQCWLNYYWKGDYIDWHGHWPSPFNAWHGFFCVSVEPNSSTLYRWKDSESIIEIPSENGLMVMGISDGDKHRSTEWNQQTPRITVAFDIVPVDNSNIKPEQYINHWIPI